VGFEGGSVHFVKINLYNIFFSC